MIRAISIFAFVLVAMTASAESLKLSSHYKAVGTNPDGSAYAGSVAVDILSDTTFAIRWTIDGTLYKGFGMRRNDALAATYTIDGEPGLIIYQVDGDGVMSGLWAVRGRTGNGTERLTPAD
jgi:hypothetical protein